MLKHYFDRMNQIPIKGEQSKSVIYISMGESEKGLSVCISKEALRLVSLSPLDLVYRYVCN